MTSSQSRFEIHSRRSMLIRSVALGALVTLPGLACGSSDKDAFSGVTSPSSVSTDAPTTDGSSGSTDTTGSVSTDAPATNPAPTGDVVPDSAEMAVNFTFSTGGGGFGPARNPYIAVWVEDGAGNLVKTVALWVQQDFKAERYIEHMTSWYSLTGGDLTLSTPTRVAGDYSVLWDGTDDAGNRVAQGDYTLYIEGAREHGPYELIAQPVTVGTEGFSVTAEDQGEITGVSIDYTV